MMDNNSEQSKRFCVNQSTILLVRENSTSVPVEAVVLSANNRLILHGATGMAGWLDRECPDLHQVCQRMRKEKEMKAGRGILPGDGIVTDGPMNMKVIHAVSVDYDHPGNVGRPYAGMDTVSAATLFSLQTAIEYGFRSIAMSPMCTRGHANMTLPLSLAEELLPSIQIQAIWGRLLTFSPLDTLKEIYFCIPRDNEDRKPDILFNSVLNTLRNLSENAG